MDRKDFFAALGISTAALALVNCIGCSAKGDQAIQPATPPTGIDFTLDLKASANAPLLTNGGYIASNSLLVARTLSGTYIAVQQSCTHQSYPLQYDGNNHQFLCNNHGATFNETGTVTRGPASTSLVTYKTQLTGSSLRIYS